MKQIEVQIMGQSYLLRCPENGEAHLLQAVQKVDEAMCKIRDAGKIKARDRIAVLASLNLAFELVDSLQSGAAAANTTPAPAPVPSPAPEPSAAPSAPSQAAEALSSADAAVLAGLVERLDAALGDDGRLF